MHILVSCESDIVSSAIQLALAEAGHEVACDPDPRRLASRARGARALLVDAGRARLAIALLRERGFHGRALLVGDAAEAEGATRAREVGADGALATSPAEDLPARFARAVGTRRLLIVDDSEIAARLLKDELRHAGFEIHCAPDAETATRLMLKRDTRPDLVLLDIDMPRVSGPQLCRFIKRNDRFKAIKVVFCWAGNREKAAALVRECGADGFILKHEFLGKWVVENT